jgi:sugar diacid utilization regulator
MASEKIELSAEERELILDFVQASMNIQAVARKRRYHRTAILYRLRKLHSRTGLNPQVFLDLLELYRMAGG